MIAHPNRSKKKPRTTSRTTASPAPRPRRMQNPRDYTDLLTGVTFAFQRNISPLFCTDAEGLYDIYLSSIPSRFRQHHTCSACRRFIETYGGLVYIRQNNNATGVLGEQVPAMWLPEVMPDFYRPAFKAMHDRVMRAKVTSPFLTKERTWGLPSNDGWAHMAVMALPHQVYEGIALTAGQAMAAARENVKTVSIALGEFTPAMLDQALRLLESERLVRSEKFIGPARWLRSLHDLPKGPRGHNLLWAAVAAAPDGYCHPRASVIGPLLEDIAAGKSFEDIRGSFNAKLHPLDYQRPQAAPAAGNIKAAEALVDKLGIARALERRFARLDELETIWKPRTPAPPAPGARGVFGHLLPAADAPPVELPAIPITWDKFSRVVLPNADKIEVRLGYRAPLIAFTTAQNPDAPLIFKWDSPVAWYLYGHRPGAEPGSEPSAWGVAANSWLRVTAVVPLPTMWGDRPSPHLEEGVVLVIANCVDRTVGQGNALFPETLRGDLHGVRATIEAYSKSAVLGGRESASACGFDIRKGSQWTAAVRVFASSGWAEYTIDRWD